MKTYFLLKFRVHFGRLHHSSVELVWKELAPFMTLDLCFICGLFQLDSFSSCFKYFEENLLECTKSIRKIQRFCH